MTFHEACRKVIEAAKTAKPGASIQYAATYARAGLNMTHPSAVRVQALYIRNNLSGWRGSEAREVKLTLDKIGNSAV